MREIKFRAWNEEEKKMFKVVSLSDSNYGDCEVPYIKVCELDKSLMDKYTEMKFIYNYELMQYTGLKDKNDKEIYEGDIVTGEESKIICEVIYTEGAMFMLRWHDTKWGNDEYHHYGLGAFTLEVIGNIYEDKHLLGR